MLFSSVAQSCPTLCNPMNAAHQASLSITNSWSSLRLMSIKSVMPSSPLILCHPCLLLPSISPSTMIFSSELSLHIRWPKYWSFSLSISPSSEYSRLISFRAAGLISLLSRRLSKSLLQRNSKASILRHSAFFMVQQCDVDLSTLVSFFF